MRSPAHVEGTQGFLPQCEKDLESPTSTCLEARICFHGSIEMTRTPSPRIWSVILIMVLSLAAKDVLLPLEGAEFRDLGSSLKLGL